MNLNSVSISNKDGVVFRHTGSCWNREQDCPVHLWRHPINHSFKPFNVNKSLSKSSIQGRWPFKKKMTSQIKLNILFDLQPSHFLNPYCFVIVAVFELSSCHVAQAGLYLTINPSASGFTSMPALCGLVPPGRVVDTN